MALFFIIVWAIVTPIPSLQQHTACDEKDIAVGYKKHKNSFFYSFFFLLVF
jgi:hypothetical protein